MANLFFLRKYVIWYANRSFEALTIHTIVLVILLWYNCTMRRFFFCILIFCCCYLSAQVTEADFVVRDKVLVRYRGMSRDVVIPPRLGINRIGERAFAGSAITSVVIPMGVGHIDDQAFMNCSFLRRVTLPNTVIVLGRRAFFNCTLLENINIPRSLITIGEGAFYNCRSLRIVNIPDTVRNLGTRAFAGCTGIQSLSISRRTTLGNNPFMGIPVKITFRD